MNWRTIGLVLGSILLVGGGSAVLLGVLLALGIYTLLPERDYFCSPTFVDGGMAAIANDIRNHPQDAQNFVCRAGVYEGSYQFDLAIADWTRVTEIRSRDPRPYYFRSRDLARKEDYMHALTDLNTAIRLDRFYRDAYLARAKIYEKMGQREQAIADYRSASPFWHTNPEAEAALKRLTR
jgi:tetratricopeptide (TPR) repeat protein